MKSTATQLTIVLLTMAIRTNMSLSAPVFFDDFSDENLRDGVPTTWSSGTVEDGNLILTGTGYASTVAIGTLTNTSIRTQFTRPEGCCIGVATRYTPGPEGTNYYASYSTLPAWRGVDTGVGGDLDASVGPGGTVISDLGSQFKDFDVSTEDIVMQFDVVGNEIKVWAWRPNEPMPKEPDVMVVDDRIKSGPMFLWVGSEDVFGERMLPATGAFRYVHVADAHIPDQRGDMDQNGILNSQDIDRLSAAIRSSPNDLFYDLNSDSLVSDIDRTVWVHDVKRTFVGDANLDLEFNSTDLVAVLASGTYEAGLDSSWATGDFNGDLRTNSSDLVDALADGGYEAGPRVAVAPVPEPTACLLLTLGVPALMLKRRTV
jgi:hypothetical protein